MATPAYFASAASASLIARANVSLGASTASSTTSRASLLNRFSIRALATSARQPSVAMRVKSGSEDRNGAGPTTTNAPRSTWGRNTDIAPSKKKLALLSVGEPAKSAIERGSALEAASRSNAAAIALPWNTPTWKLSNVM